VKAYKYIFFDWDGCLAKTLQIWLEAYKAVFAEYGIYPEDREIAEKVFGDWNGPRKLGVEDIDSFTRKLLAIVNEKSLDVKLHDGVKEILDTLKSRGRRLALLTSSKRAIIETGLRNNRIEEYFEIIFTTEDVENNKPHPEMINKAINKLNGNKEGSIMIGDSKKDLGAANNAKIDSILFYPKEHELFYDFELLNSYKPTYVIDDFKELGRILK